jgi:hypothetical protein
LIFTVNNYKNKLEIDLKDEGCEIINEILLENKKIEKMDLRCKLSKIIKVNQISSNGVNCLKESLIKNQFLKEISFVGK